MEFATSTKKYDTKSIKNMIEGLNETPIEDLEQFLKDNLVQHLEEHPHEHVMHYLPYMYYKEHNFRCIEPDDTRILFNNDLAKVKSIFDFVEKNNLQKLVDTCYFLDDDLKYSKCILKSFRDTIHFLGDNNLSFIFMFDKMLDMGFKDYPNFTHDMIEKYYQKYFDGKMSDKKTEIFKKILDKKENITEILKFKINFDKGNEEKRNFIFSYIAFKVLNNPFSFKPCETYKDFKDYLENEIGIKNHMDLLRCNKEIHDTILTNMKELYKHEYKLCFPEIYTP